MVINPFNTAAQHRYLCKQCRSRWDGSSYQDLHYYFDGPLFSTLDLSKLNKRRVHIINAGLRGFKCLDMNNLAFRGMDTPLNEITHLWLFQFERMGSPLDPNL